MSSSRRPLEALRGLVAARGFVGQVLRVASGTAAGQLAIVAVSPLLSRLYTTEELGLFATFFALMTLVAPVVSLRFSLAIVIPESEDEAHDLARLALVFPLATFALVEVAAHLIGSDFLRKLNAPELSPYMWLIPVAALLTAHHEGLSMWAIRRQRFGRVAGSKAFSGLAKALGQSLLGLARTMGSFGLILGDLMGKVVGVLVLILGADLGWRRRSNASAVALLVRYRDLGLLSAPAALINGAGRQVASLLLAAYFGMEVAGIFALGQRVIAVPLAFVGQAIAQVYIGAAGRLARDDPARLRRLYLKVTGKLLLIGAVPLAILAAGGPPLFRFAFGEDWGEAGVFVRILAAMYLLQFVCQPVSQTLNVLGRNAWQLAWDIGRLAAIVGAITAAGAAGWGPRPTIAAFGVAMALCYAALLLLNWLALTRIERPADDPC